jgi:uncharacterized protein YijF (DUF1287 family)
MIKSMVVLVLIFVAPVVSFSQTEFGKRLSKAALELTNDRVVYDPSYFRLDYPMGDVPADRGVCTDVVIRAYRKLGIDLQQLVHEDMRAHFSSYPNKWNLTKTDRNIDHRRVPNLMKFFERHGQSVAISDDPMQYQPGDIVCWMLPGNLTHIGIVVDKKSPNGRNYQVVHNIGAGQVIEDCLFTYRIIGHYRFEG